MSESSEQLAGDPPLRLLRNSTVALSIRIGGAGVMFVLQVVIARYTDAATYGLLVLVLGWVGLAVLVCNMGMDTLVVRLIAQYVAVRDHNAIRKFLVWVHIRLLQHATVLGLLGFGMLWILSSELTQIQLIAFSVALPLTWIVSWNSLLQAFLQGLGRPAAFAPDQAVRPLALAILLAGWIAMSDSPPGGVQLVTLTTFSVLAALAFSIIWSLRSIPEIRSDRVAFEAPRWSSTLFPLLLIGGAQVILGQTDIVFLGFFTDEGSVGIYGAATRIVQLTTFGLAAINAIAAPVFARLYAAGDLSGLQRVVTQSARAVFAFTAVVVIALWLGASWILNLFGEEFGAASTALKILLLGYTVSALAGSVGYLQTMTGHEAQAARLMVIAAILNIGLNLLLIPLYGIEGAAIATAIALVYWNVAGAVFVHRRLGVRSTIL